MGLSTAILPLALYEQPAGATVTEDRESKTIEFAGVSSFVTCSAYLDVVHDTDVSDHPTYSATATADPGCDRTHGDAHHVVAWPQGKTVLDNLVFLCDYHHHVLHKPRWHATFDGTTLTVTNPDHRHSAAPNRRRAWRRPGPVPDRRASLGGRNLPDMQRATARLVVCSFAGVLALAACGGSSASSAGAPGTKAPKPTTATATKTSQAATHGVTATNAINLSGTPGVTPAEQQRAEKLIADTIVGLKRLATPAEAYAAGYRSIGDGETGDEHYVNWAYSNDGHLLDPQRPESVVYEYRNGAQRAVAAMYQLPFGSTFADVPDVGGSLTQWHVHADLCLTNNPQQRVVSSLTSINGACPAGSAKLGDTPMLHVWIVPNQCGPFAALEGVGAGQVPTGQTRQCSTQYASVP